MNNPLKYTDPSGYIFQGPVEPEAPYWTAGGTMFQVPYQGIIPSGGYSVGTVDWLGSFDVAHKEALSYRASTGINVGFGYRYVYTEWYNVAWLPESGEIESYCLDRIDQDVELRYYLRKDYELIRRKSPDYSFYRPYNEITVHGTTYLVSKRPDDSGARLKIGDAVYYYSSEGFLSHILWNGEIYIGTEIQKFFAQKFNVDNPVTFW